METTAATESFDKSPLYVQVARDLRDKILAGILKPGDRIAPELELCQTYNVSRITIRHSIEELVRERLVTRERAKGTFVRDWNTAEQGDHYTMSQGFANEMRELGKHAITLWADVSVEKADAKLSRLLGIEIGDKTLLLCRTRGTGNKPFVYFKTYLTWRDDYPLNSDAYYGSLYELLRQRGIEMVNVSECVEAVTAPRDICGLLGIGPNKPVLKRTRSTKQANGSLREYTESYYIGSEYQYFITFS